MNDPQDWQRAKTIVADALEKPPAERAAFVESRLALYPSLRDEVESLLAADSGTEDFMARPPELPQGAEPPSALRDQSVGAWRLISEIGRGGMGVVYLAERADGAYRQQAAVKLLRGAGRYDALRMARERQALAALSHPNIARLIDGGTASEGTPYLVMEYVEGQPIDHYCLTHRLNAMQRVDLVRKVCAAVQSAHQKLLIHRDIKPSNILVDSAGEPKLLDFGIARLLEDDPHAHDLTQGGLLFTPRYASPEQVRGEPVSVATDVYGLGALLYELLAGSSPYARIANTDAGNAAALMRVVAEDKIEQPDILAQTFQPSFSKILSGDLGRILTTACAKEPSDRYPTVAALAADLDRWREGKPIDARPHSWPYIAAKFVGRHRVGTALGVFALAAIAAGVAGTIVQKNRAEQRYAQVRQIPNRVIFKYYDLIENLAGSTPVRRAMVKDALTFLDELAADSINDSQLAIEIATGYRKMGEVMFNGRNMASLGDREGGDAARAKAEKVLLSILARDPANVPALREMAHVDADIGAVMGSTGKGDEAIRRFDLATERYHQALNASPRDSDLRFDLIRNLAATAQSSINAGRSAASYLAAAEREFADWEKTQPANDVHVDNLRMLLIRTQYRQAGEIEQDIPRAIGFADREIELLDKLSAIDPDNATLWQHKQVGLMNSGALLIDQQRPEEALVRLLKAEPLSQRLRESDKENINFVGGQARLFTHKGRALSQLGRRAEAIAAFSESVRMWESLGKGEPLPYMRRQQGQAYYLLAREYAKSADLLRARAEAKRFLAYAARYPDLFAKPPAIEWIADARTLAG